MSGWNYILDKILPAMIQGIVTLFALVLGARFTRRAADASAAVQRELAGQVADNQRVLAERSAQTQRELAESADKRRAAEAEAAEIRRIEREKAAEKQHMQREEAREKRALLRERYEMQKRLLEDFERAVQEPYRLSITDEEFEKRHIDALLLGQRIRFLFGSDDLANRAAGAIMLFHHYARQKSLAPGQDVMPAFERFKTCADEMTKAIRQTEELLGLRSTPLAHERPSAP